MGLMGLFFIAQGVYMQGIISDMEKHEQSKAEQAVGNEQWFSGSLKGKIKALSKNNLFCRKAKRNNFSLLIVKN